MATSLELSRDLWVGNSSIPSADGAATTPLVRIGALVLDPDTLELTEDDRTDVLRPLPAALLFHLLRQRHRIVPKDELHRVLWPDTSVSDAALASAVRDLRRLLHDDGENQHIIRTFRGRGYRLVAPVEFSPRQRPVEPTSDRTLRPVVLEPRFVGRDLELARFERIGAEARDRRGGLLLIESESGGGRTALLDAFERSAKGALWLGVSCKDEGWVPRYDTITRILIELERAVGSDLVEGWVRADAEVAHLLPEVAPRSAERMPRIEVLASALRRLLDRALGLAPVVIAIDDIHFIDRSSLEMLCTGALGRVLLVASVDPLLASNSTRAGIDALFSERHRMRLAGLSPADIALLARGLPQASRDAAWSTRLCERTAGQPADVLAVLAELAEGERDPEQTATPLLPMAVQERFARRYARLSQGARSVVIACSALPPGASLDVIMRLAGCPSDHGTDPDPIDEALRSGLLRRVEGQPGVALNGQFARHVVLAQLSAERRRLLERRAMELLREVG